MKNYQKVMYFLLAIMITLQLSACKNKQKKPTPQKKPNITQKMPTPKELTKIENDIEKIIKEGQKLQESQQSKQSSKSSVSALAPQNQQQGGKSTSKGGNKQKQQKEPPEKKSWITIDKTVKDIHTNWNVLSPIAAKAGASTDLLNNVSTAINTLTTKSTNKLLNDTMIAANNVYKYIPEIENYFKTTSPPDIKKLRFYNRDIDFNSSIGKWDVATKDINDLKVIWKTLKVKLPKDAKTASDKFDSGLSELEKAVQAKDSTITKIKSNVLESDIKSLEKASGSKK
ncbi:hypothetical protein BFT35_13120 [Thermoanaerobacterium thermosaccharolyticum]|uniref:hypothetical protein n=1 Tax=Thermoanaerobacterium thermosaccharolyticum TaxID=1517 RepID=UPI000C078F51|nr:hypothetical protein [Thermoanaerobacterium thermosaccharolyticum]PHO06082.1 hypothetical protein BFT35_13120 [Thermoanaerobacterium thermosaccharolyticum]